jgi:hypothetical protein
MKVGDRVMTPNGPGTIRHIYTRGRYPHDFFDKKQPISVILDKMWAEHHNWSYSENELKKIKKKN